MLNALLSLDVFCDVGMNNPAAHAHFCGLRRDMPDEVGADSSAAKTGYLDYVGLDCGADNSAANLRCRQRCGDAGSVRWLG